MALPILSPLNLSVPLSSNGGGTGINLSSETSPANKLLTVNGTGDGFQLVNPSGVTLVPTLVDMNNEDFIKITEIDFADVNITASAPTGVPNFTLEIESSHMPNGSPYVEDYCAIVVLRGTSVNSGVIAVDIFKNGTLLTVDEGEDEGAISENVDSGNVYYTIKFLFPIVAADEIGLEIWGDEGPLDITFENLSLLVVPFSFAQQDLQLLFDDNLHIYFAGATAEENNQEFDCNYQLLFQDHRLGNANNQTIGRGWVITADDERIGNVSFSTQNVDILQTKQYLGVWRIQNTGGANSGGSLLSQTIDLDSETYRKVTTLAPTPVNLVSSTETGIPNFTFTVTDNCIPTDTTYIADYQVFAVVSIVSGNESTGVDHVFAKLYVNGEAVSEADNIGFAVGTNYFAFNICTVGIQEGDVIGIEFGGESLDVTTGDVDLYVFFRTLAQQDWQLPHGQQILGSGAVFDQFRLIPYIGLVRANESFRYDPEYNISDGVSVIEGNSMPISRTMTVRSDATTNTFDTEQDPITGIAIHRYLEVWSYNTGSISNPTTINLSSNTYRKLTEITGLSVNITSDSETEEQNFSLPILESYMPGGSSYVTEYRAYLLLKGTSEYSGEIGINVFLNGDVLTPDWTYLDEEEIPVDMPGFASRSILAGQLRIRLQLDRPVVAGDVIGFEFFGDGDPLDITIEAAVLLIAPLTFVDQDMQMLYGKETVIIDASADDEDDLVVYAVFPGIYATSQFQMDNTSIESFKPIHRGITVTGKDLVLDVEIENEQTFMGVTELSEDAKRSVGLYSKLIVWSL